MTAQFHDQVLFDGVGYSLVGVNGKGLFDPNVRGIEPGPMNTACTRGFTAAYEVSADQQLRLVSILLGHARIDGVPIAKVTDILGISVTAGPLPGTYSVGSPQGPLMELIDYEGRLLLASERIQELGGVNMGFQPGWRFAKVVDLTFNVGHLVDYRDVSDDMAVIREAIRSGSMPDPDGEPGGPSWVERTFTLDYGRSFGR